MTELVIAVLLVALNGFFVAAEFAIVKVRVTRVQELAEAGAVGAKMAHRAVTHLDAYLSATQLGITLASLGLGWIGEPAFAHLVEPLFARIEGREFAAHATAVTVSFLIITFLHIVFGELTPKSLAIMKPEKVTLSVAWPLHLFFLLFYPIIWVLNNVANGVLRLVGLSVAGEHANVHTTEEIRMILAESARGGSLRDSEALLVERSFEFADTPVHAVMAPRVDIVSLSLDWPPERALEVIAAHRHTRYPVVVDDDLDRVEGFIHIGEALPQIVKGRLDLRALLRPIHMAPESQSVERLLRELQSRRSEIALILDEYGGTAGMVTVKDLLEELVGEVNDEMDNALDEARWVGDRWRLLGSASLALVNRELDEALESERFGTLGGWLMGELGRIPEPGDNVETARYRYTILTMDGARVTEVEARSKGAADGPGE